MAEEYLSFMARLKRHHIFRVASGYAVVAYALILVANAVFPDIGMSRTDVRYIIATLALLFPVALVLGWMFVPPSKENPEKFSRWQHLRWKLGPVLALVIVVLAVISGIYLWYVQSRQLKAEEIAATQAPVIPAKSIAVLPFVNLSGDPKNIYFSDGITEEILNALTQIPGLKVAGRTSAFQFNDKDEDLRKVGEALGVATVLEGSVQKSGDEVRITAQLIDTRSGYHLWSEKYDRKLTSIFAVEDEISKAIADKLQVQIIGGRGLLLIRSKTDDPQAHALYLQGIAKIVQRGPALKDAVAFFEQATTRDPDYAAAWAGLSQAYELLPWYNLGDWRGSLIKAESAAQRALALNPQLGKAHAALANVLRDRLDFADAIRQYQQALVLNPGSSEIHNQYAQLLGAIDQFDAADKHERIAVSLDPLAPNPRYVIGNDLLAMHRYPEAIAEFQKVLDQAPGYTYASFELAFADLYAGHYADAEKSARTAALQVGEDPATIEFLIRAFADPSLRPDALKLVQSVHQIGEIKFGELAQAYWYCLLGADDRAVVSIEYWAANPNPGEVFNGIRYLRMPAFDPIRDDPRFKAVLKKMGLPYTPPSGTAP